MWVEVSFDLPVDEFFTYEVPDCFISEVAFGKRVEVFLKSATKKIKSLPKKIEHKKMEEEILEQIGEEEKKTFLCSLYTKSKKYYVLNKEISQENQKEGEKILKSLRAKKIGVIVGIKNEKPPFPTLPIHRFLDPYPFFSEENLEIARWISSYYACSINEAIHLFIPSARKIQETPLSIRQSIPFYPLNEEQKKIYEKISQNSHHFYPALIFGVTGSGKTEIYRHLVYDVVTKGKQALILVPEISLTPQNIQRFSSLFGEDKISVIHSKMTAEEKLAQYYRIFEKKASIILGPRSALFTPIRDLGIIIIDEEQEKSYKSSETPRYHARQVAFKIAQKKNIPLILGSATPSVETFYAAQTGKIAFFKLSQRHAGIHLPHIEIIDMRKESNIFSKKLVQKVLDYKKQNAQSILFMNRRGFAPSGICKQCGYQFSCPNCSIMLTFHKKEKAFFCHYCDYGVSFTESCPSCGSQQVALIGLGTEKLEEEIKELFHSLRVLRMDKDTTSNKHSHEKILASFSQGEADILVGTQMIAKGLDFEKVRLVGVVLADISLNLPDFRSIENTFVLLTQVVGRSGRKEKGEALIQTYLPSHSLFRYIQNHDYEGFFQEEIKMRKKYHYPPFCRIIRIVIRGENEEYVKKSIEAIDYQIREFCKDSITGPAPCPLEKINKNYRYHLFIRLQNPLSFLILFKEKILPQWKKNTKIYLEIDVDPVSML